MISALSFTYKNMVSVEKITENFVTHDYWLSLMVSNLLKFIDILIFWKLHLFILW